MSNVEVLGNGIRTTEAQQHVLDGMICPLSQTLMMDPVVLEDGFSYERAAAESWIQQQITRGDPVVSPLTGGAFSTHSGSLMIPNHSLRRSIQDLVRRVPNLVLSQSFLELPYNSSSGTERRSNGPLLIGVQPGGQILRDARQFTQKEPLQGARYFVSTSLGFFPAAAALLGPSILLESYGTVTRTVPAGNNSGAVDSRWAGSLAIVANPTRFRANSGSSQPIMAFQITATVTAVSGPVFGFVTENPLHWNKNRGISSVSLPEARVDNLEQLVLDTGYFVDEAGWFRSPSGASTQLGWSPGSLKRSDAVALSYQMAPSSRLWIIVNGSAVGSVELPELETRHHMTVWPFIGLVGIASSVSLLEVITAT